MQTVFGMLNKASQDLIQEVLPMKRKLPAAALALFLVVSAGAGYANGDSGSSDVPADHPQRADIEYAVARGWFLGYPDGTFRPGQTVTTAQTIAAVRGAFPEGATRADLATYAGAGNQALASPAATTIELPTFSDVPADHARGADIGYAAARGWFLGYPDGTFRPDRTVTAAHTAAVIGRAFPEGATRADLSAYLRAGNQALLAAGRAPAKSDEPAYTQYFVQQAIDHYNQNSRQATIDHYNSTDSIDGQWHMFIVEDENIIAHTTRPDLRNTNITHTPGVYGEPSGQQLAAATEAGEWVDYVFLDPAIGQNRQKHSWVIRHDGLVFGSGWYEDETPTPPTKADPPAYTQYFVQQAIDHYNQNGRQATIDHYNSTDSIDGQWHMFIVEDENIIAHTTRPDLRNTNITHTPGVYGEPSGQQLAAATEAGEWVDYVFLDPAIGQNRQKHSWVIRHDGLVFGSGWYEDETPTPPTKADPPAYTQYFVQQAIDHYNQNGRQATIDHYNSTDSIDGPWYMFIVEDDEVIVHATLPERIGTGSAYRTDIYGKPYGQQIADVTKAGRWVDYVFLDPAIGQNRQKHSWVIRHDNLIFGSGWYEDETPTPPTKADPPAYTQYFVQQAINRYNQNGRQATIDHYNSTDSIDGPWYIFIIEDENIIAHATRPDLRNTNITHTTDVYGQTSGQQIADATEVGRWVDYVFLNPAADQNQQKHSWVIRHDNLIFGSGWYEDEAPAPPTKADPPAYTQYFVQQAINRYNQDGRQATIDHYNSTDSIDGPWYIFIIEDGTTIALAPNPERVGTKTTTRIDVNGKNYGQELSDATESGRWVDYVRRNPATDQLEQKHSWVIKRDGLIFGSGWYEDEAPAPPTKADPPAYTQYFVQQAINRYNQDGRQATIDHYNSTDSIDGPWYIFIIEDGTTIALAPNPERVGTKTTTRIDVNGKNYGQELSDATESGRWVDYVRRNPATDQLEQKHSWVIRHDGLIFGSGWYEPAAS